ncbi:hypothetical protein [Natronococcus jeotgali]|nr:hypothetical protein [Natronococcus jeotgali]
MADRPDANRPDAERLECEYCGSRVPAPIYREHLLKACPGR